MSRMYLYSISCADYDGHQCAELKHFRPLTDEELSVIVEQAKNRAKQELMDETYGEEEKRYITTYCIQDLFNETIRVLIRDYGFVDINYQAAYMHVESDCTERKIKLDQVMAYV